MKKKSIRVSMMTVMTEAKSLSIINLCNSFNKTDGEKFNNMAEPMFRNTKKGFFFVKQKNQEIFDITEKKAKKERKTKRLYYCFPVYQNREENVYEMLYFY